MLSNQTLIPSSWGARKVTASGKRRTGLETQRSTAIHRNLAGQPLRMGIDSRSFEPSGRRGGSDAMTRLAIDFVLFCSALPFVTLVVIAGANMLR
jgi:hypothetical protein